MFWGLRGSQARDTSELNRVPGTAQSPEVLNKPGAEPESSRFVQPGAEAAGTVHGLMPGHAGSGLGGLLGTHQ